MCGDSAQRSSRKTRHHSGHRQTHTHARSLSLSCSLLLSLTLSYSLLLSSEIADSRSEGFHSLPFFFLKKKKKKVLSLFHLFSFTFFHFFSCVLHNRRSKPNRPKLWRRKWLGSLETTEQRVRPDIVHETRGDPAAGPEPTALSES